MNTLLSVVVGFRKERTILMNALLSVVVGLAVSAPVVAGMTGGILGDVDDNGRVDVMDVVWAMYGSDSPIPIPNQIDIALGDVNADGRTDSTDVRLLIAYISNPSDPALPEGIGQPIGAEMVACSVGLELSPGESCTVDVSRKHVEGQADGRGYYRFKVKADGRGYYDRFEKQVLGESVLESIASTNSGRRIDRDGFQASRIANTSRWRIDALP